MNSDLSALDTERAVYARLRCDCCDLHAKWRRTIHGWGYMLCNEHRDQGATELRRLYRKKYGIVSDDVPPKSDVDALDAMGTEET